MTSTEPVFLVECAEKQVALLAKILRNPSWLQDSRLVVVEKGQSIDLLGINGDMVPIFIVSNDIKFDVRTFRVSWIRIVDQTTSDKFPLDPLYPCFEVNWLDHFGWMENALKKVMLLGETVNLPAPLQLKPNREDVMPVLEVPSSVMQNQVLQTASLKQSVPLKGNRLKGKMEKPNLSRKGKMKR